MRVIASMLVGPLRMFATTVRNIYNNHRSWYFVGDYLTFFLLVVDWMSRMITEAHRRGTNLGVQITKGYAITHLIFVDWSLISGECIFREMANITSDYLQIWPCLWSFYEPYKIHTECY